MFHLPPESLDGAGRACLACGRDAARVLAPADALPGAMGTDLLLEHAAGGREAFRVAAALSRPYVRCFGAGIALICRPDDALWMAAHERHPEAVLAFGGQCRFRRPAGEGGLWRLSIPQSGTVTGRFKQHAVPGGVPEGRDEFLWEFRALSALKLSPT